MNLNEMLCACDCVNLQCKKNMGISHLYAAEKRDIVLNYKDLSPDCKDYQPDPGRPSEPKYPIGKKAYSHKGKEVKSREYVHANMDTLSDSAMAKNLVEALVFPHHDLPPGISSTMWVTRERKDIQKTTKQEG